MGTLSAPRRIQLRRTKGWRKPEGAIVVARPSRWGNPFVVGSEVSVSALMEAPTPFLDGLSEGLKIPMSPTMAVAFFRSEIEACISDAEANPGEWVDLLGALAELRGHDLACWCPLDQPCHADVLLELANGR